MWSRTLTAIALSASALTFTTAEEIKPTGALSLERIAQWQSADAEWDESAAEIVAYDAASKRLFVVNAHQGRVDVVDISNPSKPSTIGAIDTKVDWDKSGGVNSVAVHNGLVAVAVEHDDKQAPGVVITYQAADLKKVQHYAVGALPDMLTFTPDGKHIIVACEGEPNDDYTNDPEGQVGIITLADNSVKLAGFAAFQADDLRAKGVIINGGQDNDGDGFTNEEGDVPSTAAQDLEPEYVSVSADSKTAWIVCQENNAIAVLDLSSGSITDVKALGYKDGMSQKMDVSNKDGAINFGTYPVRMLHHPDAITSFVSGGKEYLITANEGDGREYEGKPGFIDETRIGKVTLDATAFPNAAELQDKKVLGRLKMNRSLGDTDQDGAYEQLYVYGGRSITIWDTSDFSVTWDSGSQMEEYIAQSHANIFNASNDDNEADDRSDDKGPEPEAVTVAEIAGVQYAFVGLERVGGVMVYDISKPASPVFVTYTNSRNASAKAEEDKAGDYGPESILVIPADENGSDTPIMVVGNEVSGTIAIYSIK